MSPYGLVPPSRRKKKEKEKERRGKKRGRHKSEKFARIHKRKEKGIENTNRAEIYTGFAVMDSVEQYFNLDNRKTEGHMAGQLTTGEIT
jgi:hypothetical protein